MHNRTLKKMALALTFWLAVHISPLKAQLLGPYGTSPTTFEVDANGLLWDTGTFGTGTLSLSGAGTRMFWYPGKAAFRAGYVSGTQWNDASIGYYSMAMGVCTIASGEGSTAMGWNTTASGTLSTAMGTNTTASGTVSTASGSYSTASGTLSTAMGWGSTASGNYSTASGISTKAQAYDSAAFGRYNIGGYATGGDTSWIATDPLFEIGNGTGSSAKADALVVYKNGNMTVNGTDNEMPNQTLVNGNSVLTEGLADSRYVSGSDITIGSASGNPNISLNGGTATGSYSFADGQYSTASGWNSTAMGTSIASGYNSTAMGWFSTASGYFSTAMGGSWGGETTASGWVSTAMGQSTASGNYSTAMGGGTTASGQNSTAMGEVSTASGNDSTAMGNSTASGYLSTAMGWGSTASGNDSTAMGGGTTASGSFSTAVGNATTAQAFDSVVIGQANVGLNATGGTASATTWVPTDPLFEIGNGTATASGNYWWNGPPVSVTPSDALVVYKNGNVTAQGVITAAPGGDIPMYTGE